jgi:hypothetical protein
MSFAGKGGRGHFVKIEPILLAVAKKSANLTERMKQPGFEEKKLKATAVAN